MYECHLVKPSHPIAHAENPHYQLSERHASRHAAACELDIMLNLILSSGTGHGSRQSLAVEVQLHCQMISFCAALLASVLQMLNSLSKLTFSSMKFKHPSLGTKAAIFLPFLISCTLAHFLMAELGCLASIPLRTACETFSTS